MNRGLSIVIAALVALVLALGAFAGGVLTARALQEPLALPVLGAAASNPSDQVIDQVRDAVKQQALKPSSDDSMTANAIQGILKSLDDPYAMYFDKKHYEYFQEDTQGEFGGIGVTLSVANGKASIVSVIKGTPAEKAGIKAGDEIVKIDGWTKKGWNSEDVVSRVRGKEGTTVKLLIRRKGKPDFTVPIVRAKIATPNLMTEMVGKDVGYMRLMQFNAQASNDIEKAVKDFDKKGAKGYILDLRENPGGLLAEGVNVASLFVKDGPIVRVDQRNQPEEVNEATGHKITDKPLVVLIDGDSASASEIVAGALQDYGRAKLVGVKSFGKGSVQTVQQLENGGAIKFTIAQYLTPKKRVINHKGLMPDVLVPMDVKLQAEHKTDKQFQAAVNTLRSMFR
jgi:carboxyl-terminal processing protease